MLEHREPLDSERTCPVCGKRFWIMDANWSYKQVVKALKGTVWFCSWKCMRKYEKEKPQLSGRGLRETNRQRVMQALADGLNVKEIAIMLDISPETVRYYKRGIKNDKMFSEETNTTFGGGTDELQASDESTGKAH